MIKTITMNTGAIVQCSSLNERDDAALLVPVQVAYVLGELTDLSSMAGSAVMSLCRGKAPYVPRQLDYLSSFLVVSLDYMTASVSLMHGRLPLNESDEALQRIAQCAPSPAVDVCQFATLPG
jgi:hypothetical protein